MGKYSLNEGNDELIRSILLMKYDTKKTLTENEEVLKFLISEQSNNTFGAPNGYANSTRPVPQESIRCTEEEKDKLIQLGWELEESDYLEDMVTRDEGLVDALDADTSLVGFTMDTDDANNAANTIKARVMKMSQYKQEVGFYYPSIEIVRSFYSEDEGNETLYGELTDPPGYNSDKLTKILGGAAQSMISQYTKWIEDLKKIRVPGETNPETNTAKTDNTIVKTKCPVGNGTRQEVIDFQTYVVNTIKDTTTLGRYGANKDGIDGVCGPNTRKAWDMYKSKYENKTGSDTTTTNPDEDEDSIADDNMSDIDN